MPAAKTPEGRLADIQSRMAALKAQADAIQARQKQNTKKHTDRIKVLVGAAVLAAAERDPEAKSLLAQTLDAFHRRPSDRAVLAHLLPQAASDQSPSPPTEPASPPSVQVERTDFDVPIERKDEAKAIGMRWDPVAKVWYAPTIIVTAAAASMFQRRWS